MSNLRALFIAIFAVLGAVLSVTGMPDILDSIFDSVRLSGAEEASTPADTAIQVKTYYFRRIVFVLPGKTPAERLQTAETVARSLREMEMTFGQAVERYNGPQHSSDFEFSEKKLRERTDLAQLVRLTPGQVSPVILDPEIGVPVLYEFRRVADVPTQSQTVADLSGYPGARQPPVLFALALFGAVLGAVAGSLSLRGLEGLAVNWEGMDTGAKVTLFVGVFFGVVASLPFLFALGNLGPVFAPLLTFGLTIGLSALAVYALKSMDDVLPWNVGNRKTRRSGIKLLDTNVLIDGRIYDLARTGFLEGELNVPRFVLLELQHIADSADALRRQRGRRGLDVLRHLQSDFTVEIGSHDKLAGDEKESVDSRLVRLAKAVGADLVSNDYNLNRVAGIQEVRVLNINDLALALRPTVLPGETLELLLIREGNQSGQGVGYLDDGTMVVVEQGKPYIGEVATVVVTQVIQTERGKMMFGEVEGTSPPAEVAKKRPGTRTDR